MWEPGIVDEFTFANLKLSLGNANVWKTSYSHKENSFAYDFLW